jgi:imidazolonepropionase-like amidohydrolase
MKDKTIDAFNLATIKGARAAELGDKIGSITVGKFADLVFWDKNSPGRLVAAEQDLVAAIIHHSSCGFAWNGSYKVGGCCKGSTA